MKAFITSCLAVAALTSIPSFASASCNNVQLFLGKAYPSAVKTDGGFEINGDYRQVIDPVTVACSIWSANPELTLLAVPRLEVHPQANDERRGDIEIVVVVTRSGDIVARYIEKGAAFSDAIAFDSVSLDIGRYDIKPGQRAFGFRARYSHSSSAFPFNETVLWLYALDDKAIARVLEGLTVEIGRGENDQNCTGYFETTLSTITLGDSGAERYRSLIIDTSTSVETTKPGAEDCSSATQAATHKQYVLRYGDPHYGAFDRKGAFTDASYNDMFSPILSDGK